MPQRVPLPCSTCNGNGSLSSGKCEPCDGQGEVPVYPPFNKCAHCKGSGRSPSGDWTLSPYCIACDGRGWAMSSAMPTGEQAGSASNQAD